MSNAIAGTGASFKRGDGATPEVFTTVTEVFDVSSPGVTKEDIEVTHHASPGGQKEYIAGLADGEEFTIIMNYVPGDTQQTNLRDDFFNGTGAAQNYQIIFPGTPSQTWEFAAIPKGFRLTTPIGDRSTIEATFKMSGSPTFS